jgi:pyruvoyl-dependent arginine decarboxylase (PvlArgDC)
MEEKKPKVEKVVKKHRGCKKDNPGVIEDLLNAIKDGATMQDACAAAMISTATLNDWIKEGGKIAEDIRWAQSKWRRSMAAHIETAAPKDWKAAAWLLERRDPKHYGKLQKVEMNANVKSNIAAPIEIKFVD